MSNPYRPDEPSDPRFSPGGTYDAPASPPYSSTAPYSSPVDAPSPYATTSYGSAPHDASPYASSPYAGGPYAVAAPSPQNQLALVALICSLAGLLTGFSALVGIVCGHIALAQIKAQPHQQGRGMAIAALVIGYVLLALVVLGIIAFVALINSAASYS